MKLRVPYLMQDPVTQQAKGLEPTEEITFDREAFCLDGPVTRRVAILDFDPETGELCRGARFVPGGSRDDPGRYKAPDLSDLTDLSSKEFMQVNALATVQRAHSFATAATAMRRILLERDEAPSSRSEAGRPSATEVDKPPIFASDG